MFAKASRIGSDGSAYFAGQTLETIRSYAEGIIGACSPFDINTLEECPSSEVKTNVPKKSGFYRDAVCAIRRGTKGMLVKA